MPISSPLSYDNAGNIYNSTRVIIDGQFNADACESYLFPDGTDLSSIVRDYSPLYISTAFAMSYGLSFASLTGIAVHTFRKLLDISYSFLTLIQYGTDTILFANSEAVYEMRQTFMLALCWHILKYHNCGTWRWEWLHLFSVLLPLKCGIQRYAPSLRQDG